MGEDFSVSLFCPDIEWVFPISESHFFHGAEGGFGDFWSFLAVSVCDCDEEAVGFLNFENAILLFVAPPDFAVGLNLHLNIRRILGREVNVRKSF